MKPRRRLGFVFGCFSVIIFVTGVLCLRSLSLSDDASRVAEFQEWKPQGKILKAADLVEGQRIEIGRIRDGHGVSLVCTFIVTGGPSGQLVAINRSVLYKKNWGAVPDGFYGSAFCAVTVEQRRDIDVFLRFLRNKIEPLTPYYDTYEVDYFSGDQKIGSEKAVDYQVLDREFDRCSYDELPVRIRTVVSIDDWRALQSASALLNDLEEQARQQK